MRIPLLDRLYTAYAAAAEGAERRRSVRTRRAPEAAAARQAWRLLPWTIPLALIKLLLIFVDEVVARPADAWYLLGASAWYWGGSFGDDAFLRPAGYPLWLAFVDSSGVPLRLAIELLQMGAAGFLAWCVHRLGHPRWAAVLVFAVVVFHPVSFDINNYIHPDTLYAPVLLAMISFLVLHYLKRDVPVGLAWAAAAGLMLALLLQTRSWAPAEVLWVVLFGSIAFMSGLRRRWPWRPALLQGAIAVALPLTVAVAATCSVRALNSYAFGVFADSEQTAPGFRALERALLSIGSDSAQRFVPVPRAARERAYAVSPALAELRPYIEGPDAAEWRRAGRVFADSAELGREWLMLAVRSAARRAGRAGTAAEAERFYRRAAAELRQACAQRRLVCRGALARARADGTSPVLRGGSEAIARFFRFFQPWAAAREKDDPALRGELTALFDDVANRRRSLAQRPVVTVSGWAYVPGDTLSSIRMVDPEGRLLAATDSFAERPDLVDLEARIPLRTGFTIQFASVASAEPTAEFTARSGRTFTTPALRLTQRGRTTVTDDTGAELHLTIETVRRPPGGERPLAALANPLERRIAARYGLVLLVLTGAALGAAVALALPPRGLADMPPAGILALLAGIVVIGVIRVSVTAAFDRPMIGYDGLFPFMCVYSTLLVLMVSQAVLARGTKAHGHERRRHDRTPALVEGIVHKQQLPRPSRGGSSPVTPP